QVPAREGVPGEPERVGLIGRRICGRVGAAVERAVAILEHVEVEGVDHRLLAREVEIDRAHGDAGLARDGGHRGVVKPEAADESERGGEDRIALLEVRAYERAGGFSHGTMSLVTDVRLTRSSDRPRILSSLNDRSFSPAYRNPAEPRWQ